MRTDLKEKSSFILMKLSWYKFKSEHYNLKMLNVIFIVSKENKDYT